MKRVALGLTALLIASPAFAQSAQDITSSLNGGPPVQQPAPQPQPAPASPTVTPPPQLAMPAATQTTAPAPSPTSAQPAPATPQPAPAASEPAAETPPPPPPETRLSPLDAAQVAAAPFTIDLPPGFALYQRPSSNGFEFWTVRRDAGAPFVSVYFGADPQYPIYEGREVTLGGRTSVVINEGQGDRAMEHIFRSTTDRRQLHVWVGSVDDADRALAEAIAQSVQAKPF